MASSATLVNRLSFATDSQQPSSQQTNAIEVIFCHGRAVRGNSANVPKLFQLWTASTPFPSYTTAPQYSPDDVNTITIQQFQSNAMDYPQTQNTLLLPISEFGVITHIVDSDHVVLLGSSNGNIYSVSIHDLTTSLQHISADKTLSPTLFYTLPPNIISSVRSSPPNTRQYTDDEMCKILQLFQLSPTIYIILYQHGVVFIDKANELSNIPHSVQEYTTHYISLQRKAITPLSINQTINTNFKHKNALLQVQNFDYKQYIQTELNKSTPIIHVLCKEGVYSYVYPTGNEFMFFWEQSTYQPFVNTFNAATNVSMQPIALIDLLFEPPVPLTSTSVTNNELYDAHNTSVSDLLATSQFNITLDSVHQQQQLQQRVLSFRQIIIFNTGFYAVYSPLLQEILYSSQFAFPKHLYNSQLISTVTPPIFTSAYTLDFTFGYKNYSRCKQQIMLFDSIHTTFSVLTLALSPDQPIDNIKKHIAHIHGTCVQNVYKINPRVETVSGEGKLLTKIIPLSLPIQCLLTTRDTIQLRNTTSSNSNNNSKQYTMVTITGQITSPPISQSNIGAVKTVTTMKQTNTNTMGGTATMTRFHTQIASPTVSGPSKAHTAHFAPVTAFNGLFVDVFKLPIFSNPSTTMTPSMTSITRQFSFQQPTAQIPLKATVSPLSEIVSVTFTTAMNSAVLKQYKSLPTSHIPPSVYIAHLQQIKQQFYNTSSNSITDTSFFNNTFDGVDRNEVGHDDSVMGFNVKSNLFSPQIQHSAAQMATTTSTPQKFLKNDYNTSFNTSTTDPFNTTTLTHQFFTPQKATTITTIGNGDIVETFGGPKSTLLLNSNTDHSTIGDNTDSTTQFTSEDDGDNSYNSPVSQTPFTSQHSPPFGAQPLQRLAPGKYKFLPRPAHPVPPIINTTIVDNSMIMDTSALMNTSTSMNKINHRLHRQRPDNITSVDLSQYIAKADYIALDEKHSKMSRQYELMKEDRDLLSEELARNEGESEVLQKKIHAYGVEVEEYKGKLRDLAIASDTNTKETSRLVAEKQAIANALNVEKQDLTIKLHEKEDTIKQLQQQLENIKNDISCSSVNLSARDDQLLTLNQELDRMKKELADARMTIAANEAKHQAYLQNYQASNAALLEDLQSKLTVAVALRDTLDSALAEKVNVNEGLQSQLDDFVTKINALNQHIEKLNLDYNQVVSDLTNAQQTGSESLAEERLFHRAALDQQSQQIDKLTHELNEKATALAAQTAELAEKTSFITTQSAELDSTKADLAAKSDELSSKFDQTSALSLEITSLVSKNDELIHDIAAKDALITTLQESMSADCAEVSALQQTNAELNTSIKKLQLELEQLTDSMATISTLQEAHSIKDAEYLELQEKYLDLEQHHFKNKSETADLVKKMAELQTELHEQLVQMMTEHQATDNEKNTAASAEIVELIAQNNTLTQTVESLLLQIDKMIADNTMTTSNYTFFIHNLKQFLSLSENPDSDQEVDHSPQNLLAQCHSIIESFKEREALALAQCRETADRNEELTKLLANVDDSAQNVTKKLAELTNQLAEAATQLIAKDDELVKLQSQIIEHSASLTQLQESVATKDEELSHLIAQLATKSADADALQSELSTKSEESATLQSKFDDLQSTHDKSVIDLTVAAAQILSLQQQIDLHATSDDQKLVAAQAEHTRLEEVVQKASDNAKMVAEQLEKARADIDEKQSQLDSVHEQLTPLQAQHDTAIAEIAVLQQQLLEKDSHIAQLVQELAQLHQTVADRERNIVDLEEQLAGKDADVAKIAELNAIISNKDKEINELTIHMNGFLDATYTERLAYETEQKVHLKHCDNVSVEFNKFMTAYNQIALQYTAVASDLDNVKLENSQLKEVVDNLSQAIALQEDVLEDAETDPGQNEETQQLLSDLSNSVSILEAQTKEIELLRILLQQKDNEILKATALVQDNKDHYTQQIIELQERISELEAQKDTADEQNAKKDECAELVNIIELKNQHISELASSNAQKDAEFVELQSSVTAKENEITTLTFEKENQLAQITSLRSDIATKDATIKAAAENLALSTDARVKELTSALQSVEDEKSELVKQLDEIHAQVATNDQAKSYLTIKNDELTAKLSNNESRCENLESKLQNKSDEISALNEEINRLNNIIQEQRATADELVASTNDAVSTCDILGQKIEILREQYVGFKATLMEHKVLREELVSQKLDEIGQTLTYMDLDIVDRHVDLMIHATPMKKMPNKSASISETPSKNVPSSYDNYISNVPTATCGPLSEGQPNDSDNDAYPPFNLNDSETRSIANTDQRSLTNTFTGAISFAHTQNEAP